MTFDEALASVPQTATRRVLLGNGFSRACRDDIFSYSTLFDQANFNALSPAAEEAFRTLGTTAFEIVMRALRNAATLVQLYAPEEADLSQRFRRDAEGLREVLVRAIAENHPDRPGTIPAPAYSACRAFLANFHSIYTLNYDLLLYWALMQEEIEPSVLFDDGFRTPDEGAADYVTWDVEKTDRQNIFYLHGALHIFDGGHEIQKYTWVNTGIPLIEQIRSALEADLYPLFVAEGDSNQKLERIRHSDFLFRAYRSFSKIGGALFVHGHSMGPSDEHIVRLIEKNAVSHLYVGLHGDPESESNRRIKGRAEEAARRRPVRRPLEISYYDAASAHVWG